MHVCVQVFSFSRLNENFGTAENSGYRVYELKKEVSQFDRTYAVFGRFVTFISPITFNIITRIFL